MKMRVWAGLASVSIGVSLAVPASAETIQEKTERRMNAMDTDRDGLISLEEFTEFRRGWTSKRDDGARLMRPEAVQRAFDAIDTDGDATISFDELQANTAKM